MKIILSEDIENLGDMGDTVTVAAGYARNYLLPRRMAVIADSVSAKEIEHHLRIIKRKEEKRNKELSAVVDTLEGVHVSLTAKASPEGRLYGSVSTINIAEKLAEQGHEVDRRKIRIAEPIKSVGDHTITLRLAKGIEATIKVTVEGEAGAEPEEVEAPSLLEQLETAEQAETEEAEADTEAETEAASAQTEDAPKEPAETGE